MLKENKKPEQVELDVVAESVDKKYLLVGECKWSAQEDAVQLPEILLRKARLLPFAKNRKIVPVLFLKVKPKEAIGNILRPEQVIALSG